MRTDYIYIGNEAFSKELLLISLENLHYLHKLSILMGKTPSELVNELIKQKEKEANK